MKLDLTKVLLVSAILYIGWISFFKGSPDLVVEPVTITIPKVEGTTGLVPLEPKVVREKVYIKGDIVEVDSGYKEKYEKAKDSVEKLQLYLEAIKITNPKGVIVDNKDIKIYGEASVRGTLLDYKIDYELKEKSITYTPEVVTRLPKLAVGLGIEVGIPLILESNFVVKANLDLINSKGNQVNLSYDTEQRLWFGVTKTFRLIK